MKTLEFEYHYKIEFDNEVDQHQFQLRCIPRDGTHQKVLDIHYEITPSTKVTRINDGFGNPTYVGSCIDPHPIFEFHVNGKMITSNIPLNNSHTCYPIYKYFTQLTKPSTEIKEFAKQNKLDTDEKTAWNLMHKVYEHMHYVPGSTNNATTAANAFQLKNGVCQDYAHILISALRYLHIPARYVAGMMIGEGATHAWVDAYVDNHFIHLDPTNNCEADEKYIKLSHGRDFNDCILDKGLFNTTSQCHQKMEIHVKVNEV